jgi:hypothetical protein
MNGVLYEQIAPEILQAIFAKASARGLSVNDYLRNLLGLNTDSTTSDLTDTEIEVMATVGGFLNDHLPDRFCAGRPQFDQDSLVWKTPILISYPTLGPLGQVGKITVSADAGKIVSFTPLEEMKTAAQAIIELHREEIESPLS